MTRATEVAASSQPVLAGTLEGIAKTIDCYMARRDYREPLLGDPYDTPRLGALT